MSCRPWCPLVLAGLLLTAVGSCSDGDDKTNPVQPVNHNPVISSATIFPLSIGPSDSAIAICSAVDPDGDSLYYDWIGDTRVRLKGTGGGSYLFDSPLNYQVFYYGTPPALPDTAYIRCFTRDHRGGSAGTLLVLLLHP